MGWWSTRELEYLRVHAAEGAETIAEALGRSVHAVEVVASRERVSLRRSWLCPKCGRVTYKPLSQWSGWCRTCSMAESKDKAAIRNREVRRELEMERQRELQIKRERQAIYSDTNKRRAEIRKIIKSREANEKSPIKEEE